jgi:hypothetical protein
MSVNVISSNSSLQTLFLPPKQDLQALQTDLSSGNLAGAQKDFASFQKDTLNLFQNSKPGDAQAASSQLSTDLQALQSALSSGNLTGAQKAFAAFQQDLQNTGIGHKDHHRHHRHQEEDTKSTDANSQNSTNGSASNSASGLASATSGITSGGLMKSLLSAYQTFTPASSTGISVIG